MPRSITERAKDVGASPQKESPEDSCQSRWQKWCAWIDPSTPQQTIAILPAAFMRRHRTGYALEISSTDHGEFGVRAGADLPVSRSGTGTSL
jgi:hypothetical protein